MSALPTVSSNALIELLLAEIQYPDDSPVPGNIRTLWEFYADKVYAGPHLQYWYTKRHCLDMCLGGVWQDVTWSEGGVNQSDGQLSQNLQTMRSDVQTEIDKIELRAKGNRAPAVGQLTQTAPIMARPGQMDPNRRALRGDPLKRW